MSHEQLEEAMQNAAKGQGQDGQGQQIEMSLDMQNPSGEGTEGENAEGSVQQAHDSMLIHFVFDLVGPLNFGLSCLGVNCIGTNGSVTKPAGQSSTPAVW